jgi:hypothetical protein
LKRLQNTRNGGEISSHRCHFSGRTRSAVDNSYVERLAAIFSQVQHVYTKFNLFPNWNKWGHFLGV